MILQHYSHLLLVLVLLEFTCKVTGSPTDTTDPGKLSRKRHAMINSVSKLTQDRAQERTLMQAQIMSYTTVTPTSLGTSRRYTPYLETLSISARC